VNEIESPEEHCRRTQHAIRFELNKPARCEDCGYTEPIARAEKFVYQDSDDVYRFETDLPVTVNFGEDVIGKAQGIDVDGKLQLVIKFDEQVSRDLYRMFNQEFVPLVLSFGGRAIPEKVTPFAKELEDLLNKHYMDSRSNTSAPILAHFLQNVLVDYNQATKALDKL
jgi:hypothetical protein